MENKSEEQLCLKAIPNPFTAEAQIVLADKVSRRLKIDLHAMAIAENVGGAPFLRLASASTPELIRIWLYGGLQRDAMERAEEWTFEKLTRLAAIPDLVMLSPIIKAAIISAFPDPNGRLGKYAEKDSASNAAPDKNKKPWSWEYALWLAFRMGIHPDQFYRMTLREFHLFQDAFYVSQREQNRFDASMTVSIMNCWLKRPITVDRLFGTTPDARTFSDMSASEKNAALSRIKQKLESGKVGKQKEG
jgi:hypothetical protein